MSRNCRQNYNSFNRQIKYIQSRRYLIRQCVIIILSVTTSNASITTSHDIVISTLSQYKAHMK